ncbi:MAG: phospholipase D-like domain-containing protein [Burkholderiaceae bacterium]
MKVAVLAVVLTLVIVWLLANLATGEKRVAQRIEHRYAASDPQFQYLMGVLLGPPVVPGNQVGTLINGDQIFSSMLTAIGSAQQSVCFETFIYWSGDIGRAFADALAERARAGVSVLVMLDWIGTSKMDAALLDELREAGAQIERYHKPSWTGLGKLNNRTHRKLLIVDGRIGFTGGVGIADEWTGDAQDPMHWRDTHFRIVGPAVAQMQAVFMDNWIKTSNTVLHDIRYFPRLEDAGPSPAQVFMSSANGGSTSMEVMYLLSIASAARSIRLSSSYFVPNRVAVDAFVAATKRGVKIQIITPGRNIDAGIVRAASRAKWGPLLKAGVEMFEYQPTMFHVKVMVVDELMVSCGSTNFDDRSFRLNAEANLNVYDAEFAALQVRVFDDDLSRSKRIGMAQWKRRPWLERLEGAVAAMMDSQL